MTETAKGPGRGNHRTGPSRGRRGRPGQVNWRDDREVRQRVRLVMRPSIINQPVPVIAEMVNTWLQERGLTPVTERTIRTDIERALQLNQERVIGGVAWFQAQFQALYADIWMSIDQTPRGRDRSPLYGDASRALVCMARIAGVWDQQAPDAGPESVFEGEVANVQELVAAGEITHDQLSAYLLVLHRETGGIGASPRVPGALLPAGGLIEGPGGQGPLPVLPRGRRNAPRLPRDDRIMGGPMKGLTPMGDELPGDVVDWEPEEE